MKGKPILVDALHINMGGGLMILNYLVNTLVSKNVDFVLLKDERCPQLQSEYLLNNIIVLPASYKIRKRFYKEHKEDYRSVLCFGNIPPYVKLNVPVHTYLHNVSLLKIPADYPFSKKLRSFVKKTVLRYYAKNSTDWIVQTSNTANLVKLHLAKTQQQILQYPFYYVPSGMNVSSVDQRKDYIFVGNHTSAKGHEYLVDAWTKLAKLGFNATLHLTVSDSFFSAVIEEAKKKGAKIINHGQISFDKVIELYNKSVATIYPSLNESLGLGIIEAIEAGCDVIGCDLPYMHSVCSPSQLFEPCNSDSIVQAVLEYEKGQSKPTKAHIHDTVIEFVEFISRQ